MTSRSAFPLGEYSSQYLSVFVLLFGISYYLGTKTVVMNDSFYLFKTNLLTL